MVAALAGRELGAEVNRKRVQRLMREHALLQRRRSEGRRRRPGFFRVERPDQLWHLDMTSVWVAEHGGLAPGVAARHCQRESSCTLGCSAFTATCSSRSPLLTHVMKRATRIHRA